MKPRVSHLFGFLWPFFIVMTPFVLLLPLFPPLVNLPLLAGLLLLASASAFYLYRTGAGRRESSSLLLLRLFLLMILLVGVLYKTGSGEIFSGLYTPLTPGCLLTQASCAAGWLLSLSFARPLVMRENLLGLFSPFDGNKLAAKTRQYSYELQEIGILTGKLRLWVPLFTALTLITLLILSLAVGVLYNYQILYALTMLLLCLPFLFYLKGLEEELLLLSEGIRLEEEWLSFKGRRYFLLVLLLGVPSFFLARWTFTLPGSLIVDFFHWIGSLFTFEPKEPIPIPPLPRMEPNAPPLSLPPMMNGEAESRPPLLTEEMKKLIRRILLGLGGAGFLLFLIHPFLTREGRRESGGFLREGLGELIGYFTRLGGLFRRKGRVGRERDTYRRIAPGRKEKTGPGRLRGEGNTHELPSAGRVLRSFGRICRWGGKRGRPYGKGMPPADYLNGLAELMPRQREELCGMGVFLNRYFYSERIIEPEEIDDFVRRTGQILKEEKQKG